MAISDPRRSSSIHVRYKPHHRRRDFTAGSGKGTDKQMHNIVATIQQEQNRIIRHDEGDCSLFTVQLAVVRHRPPCNGLLICFTNIEIVSMLIKLLLFSPNTMFNSYVSNVLPELGEENMQQVTFQEYLDHRLSKEFQVENPYEQLEYVLTAANTPSYRSRLASIRFKASSRFFESDRII